MNKDEINETNNILESIGVDPITEPPSQLKKSLLHTYAVAGAIALSSIFSYGIGHYTNKSQNTKQSVAQTLQPEVAKPLPISAFTYNLLLTSLFLLKAIQ